MVEDQVGGRHTKNEILREVSHLWRGHLSRHLQGESSSSGEDILGGGKSMDKCSECERDRKECGARALEEAGDRCQAPNGHGTEFAFSS